MFFRRNTLSWANDWRPLGNQCVMAFNFQIIQGGMGVGVSNWALARAVAQRGQLGVVSGTGIASILARRLQRGDIGGHMARAAAAFPAQALVRRVWDCYYVSGGIAPGTPFKSNPAPTIHFGRSLLELTVLAAFIEVFLAKEGHGGPVGINLLEKVQTTTLPCLFGAMLANVNYVLMGAGIPRLIPGVLDALARGQAAELRVDVQNATAEDDFSSRFDPATFWANNHDGPGVPAALPRPAFLAVVSSATLALTLARKSNGRVDGFIVEGSVAGGHNAPPRGPLQLSAGGEPIYGQRDIVDLEKIAEIGLPFYLAGGFATPDQLLAARRLGAAGIQVGTAFAFCRESGIRDDLKAQVLQSAQAGRAEVFTDPVASPTGFPFKVLQLPQSLSVTEIYARRVRRCDMGYLREIYRRDDGQAGYRCAAEPVEIYMDKGGLQSRTVGRKCLCNALFATVGLGQTDAAGVGEPPLVTAGDDVGQIGRYLRPGSTGYSAADVLDFILAPPAPPVPQPRPE